MWEWLAEDRVFAASGIAAFLLVPGSATLAWAAVNLRAKGRDTISVILAVLAAGCTYFGVPAAGVFALSIVAWSAKAPPESQGPMSGWPSVGVLILVAAWLWYLWQATKRWHTRQRLGYLFNEAERDDPFDSN